MPLMIDPGLYKSTKSDIFWVTPRRTLPTAFKLFTGWYLIFHLFCLVVVLLNLWTHVSVLIIGNYQYCLRGENMKRNEGICILPVWACWG